MWRHIFSNTWLLLAIALAVISLNLSLALLWNAPHLFQRCGSIVVLVGVLITARKVVRLGASYLNEDWNLPDDSPEGREVLLDDRSQFIIGPAVAVLGTIIAGYGDLLLKWLLV